MGRFGDQLKSEREARGISLDDMASATRVSVRLLSAIESERFDQLPGGVYNVSFVRQYARHVGLDEEEVVKAFNEVARPAELDLAESLPGAGQGAARDETGADLAERITQYIRSHRTLLPAAALVFLVLVVVAGIFLLSGDESDEDAARVQPGRAALAPAGSATQRPIPAVASQPASSEKTPLVREPSQPIHVELRVTETAWIQARADGKLIFESIFRAGDGRSIEADDWVRLFVGNAGGVELALNGKAMPPIGPPGRAQRVLLTTSGMQFVPPPGRGYEAAASPTESSGTQDPEPSHEGDRSIAGAKPRDRR